MATILLIEDDENISLNVTEILCLAKHKIITAVNGKEGIELAREIHPDLIISDVMMPGIDGFGVLHILQEDPETRDIQFIFLTSKSERTDFRHAMNLGADDFITKPFEGSDLLNAVENIIRKKTFTNSVKRSIIPSEENTSSTREGVFHEASSGKDPLQALLETCETMRYNKRHVIYKEGSMPRCLYFIKSGKIKTYKSHPDGKDLVIGLFGEGDYMGYALLLEGARHIETAEVIEDSEVIMIPRKKIEDLVNSNPKVGRKFVNLLAENLLEKERLALGLAYNTLRKKVAEALMSFDKKFHTTRDEKFTINIGRDELASIAGTATESLIRTLTEFKQENLIEINHGVITIINQNRLQHLLR
ncbi:MAG TPA: response regulator [Sphingobacteriaceae bacterium]